MWSIPIATSDANSLEASETEVRTEIAGLLTQSTLLERLNPTNRRSWHSRYLTENRLILVMVAAERGSDPYTTNPSTSS